MNLAALQVFELGDGVVELQNEGKDGLEDLMVQKSDIVYLLGDFDSPIDPLFSRNSLTRKSLIKFWGSLVQNVLSKK